VNKDENERKFRERETDLKELASMMDMLPGAICPWAQVCML